MPSKSSKSHRLTHWFMFIHHSWPAEALHPYSSSSSPTICSPQTSSNSIPPYSPSSASRSQRRTHSSSFLQYSYPAPIKQPPSSLS